MQPKIVNKILAGILSISLMLQIGVPIAYAGEGTAYHIANGALTINSSNLSTYNNTVITGNGTSNITIDGVTAYLTISDLTLIGEGVKPAIKLINSASLNLTVKGNNTLTGSSEHAAINVPSECSFTVTGESTGTLTANAGGGAAGIGANWTNANTPDTIQKIGTITINGGTVNAYGDQMGAGIGGTTYSDTGKITINGGTVYAQGGGGTMAGNFFVAACGAGIGGGYKGCVESISITGGNVTAVGGHYNNPNYPSFRNAPAAGIGCGSDTGNTLTQPSDYTCGTISITGGKVSVTGGNNNEVNAIGYGLPPNKELSEKYVGSVTISDEASVNTNGGAIHPLVNGGVSTSIYQLSITIYDGRLAQTMKDVEITVNGKTYRGDINVSKEEKYKGTLTGSFLYDGVLAGEQIIEITKDSYSWSTEVSFAEGSLNYTAVIGSKLYPVYLWCYDSAVTADITGGVMSVKRDGHTLNQDASQGMVQLLCDGTVSKQSDNVGRMTAYMTAGDATELTATVPGLNDGNPLTLSDKTIADSIDGTVLILWDNSQTEQIHDPLNLSYGTITFADKGGKMDITYTLTSGGTAITVPGQYYQNHYEIIQSDKTTATTNKIIFQNTQDFVSVKLNGVNMASIEKAIDLQTAKVRLTLSDSNTIDCGGGEGDSKGIDYECNMGICVGAGSALTIDGAGALEIKNLSEFGVGIGGYYYSYYDPNNLNQKTWVDEGTGVIRIEGGNLTISGNQGTAIGSCHTYKGNDYGSVYITGGTVNATCKSNGAAIGGSLWGKPSNVYISGGTVSATGNSKYIGTAIGGGYGSKLGGEIVISGGYVTAASEYKDCVAIGSGSKGVCPNITISGGTVVASGNVASIGNGTNGTGGSLKITGGTIFTKDNGKPTINVTTTNDGTTPVYYTTADVSAIYEKNTTVTDASIAGASYGFNDVKTDANGMLHLYLPASADGTKSEASFKDAYYAGTITSTESDNVLKRTIPLKAKEDAVTHTGAVLKVTADSGSTVYYVASTTPLTTGSEVESTNDVSSVVLTDTTQDIALSNLIANTVYNYYMVAKKNEVYSDVVCVNFQTPKKSPNLQLTETIANSVYNEKPVSHSTVKGELFTWEGDSSLTLTYYVDTNGTKTITANSGVTSEGAAPQNAGNYYLKASLLDNVEYAEAETDYIPFTIKKSATEFTDSIKTYNGDTETNTFTYGDAITVKVTPKAAGIAPKANGLRSFSAPTANEMALFITKNDVEMQISDPVTADGNGLYIMNCDTKEKGLVSGDNIIDAKYMGNSNMADYSENVTVTLNKKDITSAEVNTSDASASKEYDGTNSFTSVDLALNSSDLLPGDMVTATAEGTATDANAGIDKTFTATSVTLDGAHKDYYSLDKSAISGNVAITQAAATGVNQELQVVKGMEKEYTFDLTKLLPALSDGKSFGDITYTVGTVTNTDNVLTQVPTDSDIAHGKMTLKVANVDVKDKTEMVQIKVTSTNYQDFTADLTVKTIDQIPLTVDAEFTGGKYHGKAYAYTGIPIFKNDAETVSGITYTAKYVGRDGTTYAESETAPKDAGKYNLIFTVSGDSANTYAGTTTIGFEITKKQITAKPNEVSIKSNASFPAYTWSIETGIEGETITATNAKDVVIEAQEKGTKLAAVKEGTFDIVFTTVPTFNQSGDTEKNYDIQIGKGKLTVTRHSGGGSSSGGSSSKDKGNSTANNPSKEDTTIIPTTTIFTDITTHWAKKEIEYVTAKGYFSGTSKDKFSPDISMTRAMFVTVLGRLAKADVKSYKESSFADVKADAYYMPYIQWAGKNGIVKGVSEAGFAPNQSITREQMAVIMASYVKDIGFELPQVNKENNFADNAEISSYAKEAVNQMQMAGVLTGKDGNRFDPKGVATRAEVSAVLKRFAELVEKK